MSVQNPLVLGEHGEHYPDLVLYREGVRGRVPAARDTLVVFEVADTRLLRPERQIGPLRPRRSAGSLAG